MPFPPAAQAALLSWVNTFHVDQPAQSMDDLSDGIIFSQMLQAVDPTYNTYQLDKNVGSSKWLTEKRNLESVYNGLCKYMRREAPELLPLTRGADFRAIAESPDAAGLSQLAALFLIAVVMNANEDVRHKSIQKLQSDLTTTEQGQIRRILEQMQEEMKRLAEVASREETAGDRDPDLEAEEERLKIAGELEKNQRNLEIVQKRYVDLDSRHRYLQEQHDEVKAKLSAVETELEELHRLHGADESQRVQSLQRKLDDQANLIANQEEEIDSYQQRQRGLEVELDRFKNSAQEAQEYKDKYDELNHKVQDLERKANAADRYKQKLATQRNLEQEVATLQYELEAKKDLENQLRRVLAEKQQLEETQREILSAMGNNEQSLAEERVQKERLKAMVDELKADYAKLLHQNNVNEKYIEDMKEQIGANGGFSVAQTPDASQTAFNLEQELSGTADQTVALNLQIARLQSENTLLRNSAPIGGQMDDLRAEVERAKAEKEVATKRYDTVFEKFVVAQEQIDALIKNTTGEGQLAFQNLHKRLAERELELEREKAKNRQLEEQVKDKDRDLLTFKTDLDAVGKESLDALEALKASDQLVSASLRTELETSRKRLSAMEIENEMHKTHLLEALVAKEKLTKELEGPEAGVVAPAGIDAAQLEEAIKGYKTKIDKLRERLKSQKEQLEKADQERYELQKKLKSLESGSALAAQKAANEQIIKNLQRENAMITTAWYDLTSRLQSNHVVLQRRDQPKSWLNKQRQMVNATPRR